MQPRRLVARGAQDYLRAVRYWLILLMMLRAGAVAAQGFGGFVSPGPLAAPHAELDTLTQCLKCHEAGAGVTPKKCLSCHEDVQQQIDTGRGFHAHRPDGCVACHPDHQGRDAAMIRLDTERFNHQQTGFALRGRHAEVECADCHTEAGVWTGLDRACVSCHEDRHGGAQSARGLLRDCKTCHNDAAWKALPLPASVFDHDSDRFVDFVLRGRHTRVDCIACHADWRFVPVRSDACIDCHRDPHGAQFAPRTCEDCHGVETAKFARRDWPHDRTAFPLIGHHKGVACERCHGDADKGRYVGLPFDRCDRCHDDPHEGQFAPRDCAACHAVEGPPWALVGFDHDRTDRPLRGAHQEVACADCHGEGPAARWSDLPADDCKTCHDDAHAGRFEPQPCAECHADGSWDAGPFDHATTRFPLLGKHEVVECARCHGEGEQRRLRGLAFEACTDCHEDPHEATAPDCAGCHRPDGWEQVGFDHATTDFALQGAHRAPDCAACHAPEPGRFAERPHACSDCHEPDRPRDHYEGGCAECHDEEAWRNAAFDADKHDQTGFPLRGLHAAAPCAGCHRDGQPKAAAGTDCADCHRADDVHRRLFGSLCGDCHRESGWLPSRFRHELTGFLLEGAHRLAACEDCHATGAAGTPSDCAACHRRQRPGDALHRDPFTADCAQCHTPLFWEGARSPHGDWP